MTIPAIYGRVPSLLASQVQLNQLNRTNLDMLALSTQMSSGYRLQRPSDDPIAASVVSSIDQKLERDGQRDRNMSHADSVMTSLDSSLMELGDLVREAKTVALEQVQSTADEGTRASMANVIQQQITQLFGALNRDFAGVSLFAGSRSGSPAIESFHGAYRYLGDRDGLRTDLGPELDFPITLAADEAVGALSSRVEGDVDLDPQLTADTFVRDLRGTMEGKTLGTLEIGLPSGTPTQVTVDLSGAETIGDVAGAIESAIRGADAGAFGALPWGSGVTVNADQLVLNLDAGHTATFSDGPVGQTASALGLSGVTYNNATFTNPDPTARFDPKVTERTLLGDMAPGTPIAYGDIVFSNGGRTGTVTTNAGMTVGEFIEAVDRLDLGIRVEVDESNDSLNVVNEVAGMAMSISDGGVAAATTLGIRTMQPTTPLSAFNFGRGVEIAHGRFDPITGLPDADRNVDFEVTLSDGTTTFTVDLEPGDMDDLSTVLAKINAESGGVGGFTASLAGDRNAIVFNDALGGGTPISVRSLNGYAAEDLGLLDGTTSAGDELISSDRSTSRVDGLFSTLLDLRDALTNNDQRGIGFAGERLEADAERVAQAQGLIGTRVARVEAVQSRLGETRLTDQKIKSDLQDLDFIEATTRLNLLQTQLQAGLQVAALTRPMSLLNFLG